jgi:hypothetical protein
MLTRQEIDQEMSVIDSFTTRDLSKLLDKTICQRVNTLHELWVATREKVEKVAEVLSSIPISRKRFAQVFYTIFFDFFMFVVLARLLYSTTGTTDYGNGRCMPSLCYLIRPFQYVC